MTAITENSARRERLFHARDSYETGGLGYSRLVRSLRLALPLMAAGVLLFATLWPNFDWRSAILPDELEVKLDAGDIQDLRMRDARLVGVDEEGRPYELSAVEARQGATGGETVILEAPTGRVELEDGAHLSLAASQGHYDRKAELLELTGGVTVQHGHGYSFQSESARVEMNTSRAVGNQPIHGTGPEGEIFGEGFEILEKGQTVKILGKSRLIITSVPEQK